MMNQIVRSQRVVVVLGKYYIHVSIYNDRVEKRFRLTKTMIDVLKALKNSSVSELKKGYNDKIYLYTYRLRRQGLIDEKDRVTELGEEVLRIIDSATKIVSLT